MTNPFIDFLFYGTWCALTPTTLKAAIGGERDRPIFARLPSIELFLVGFLLRIRTLHVPGWLNEKKVPKSDYLSITKIITKIE